MAAIDYVHHPHPHTERKKLTEPPKIADQHVGFNGRLGAAITRSVGTMWAFYIAAVFMGTWMVLAGFAWGPLHGVDPYPFPLPFLFFFHLLLLFLFFFFSFSCSRCGVWLC